MASIIGLLGAFAYYGRRGSNTVERMADDLRSLDDRHEVFGTGTDNVAHTGGFIGGVLLDPRKAETGDHTLAAVDCLLLTVASIVASVVVPLSMR